LFFDEIQACIPAISSLRYFYEKLPELHLIAAGSLLEFALQVLPSFGVGRVRSLFLHPFSFDEYLRATNFAALADSIKNASPDAPYSDAVHQECLQHLIRFILIGGMPEVVATYASGGSLLDCQAVLDDLIISLQADFSKYKARVPASRLREVFASIVSQTGHKFVYSRVSQTANHAQIKEGVDLLEMAGIIHPVTHTSGNGIPLAAEQNVKFRKYLLFDTGIFQRFLKLDISSVFSGATLEQTNKGALADLFAGLELLKSSPPSDFAQLHYWQREQRGSNAEVDYLVQRNGAVIPVEIKSGVRGAMQSLHLFLAEKKAPYGIRCSFENFGKFADVRIFPLYAAGRI
jgi:predicted AAA+ superfamily ATPase